MTTSDKHCQTFTEAEELPRVMYDESVAVVNAREIDSPPSSGEEEAVRAAMAKFTPPARHTARHDFDSESDSDSSPDKFTAGNSEEDESPERPKSPDNKDVESNAAAKNVSGRRQASKRLDSSNSESDSGDVGLDRPEPLAGSGRRRGGGGVVIPAEGAYDPKQFQDLKVPPEMENIFQYIMKYTPQKIDIELKLQPFLPEYVPAVGDADAFLKVSAPGCGPRLRPLAEPALECIDNLGLTVLDEPSAEQSDAALLHLQLRAISKSSAKSTVLTRKIEDAEKNPKAIERWIKDVSELHTSKPPPTVTYTSKMPDIDSLMEEWPSSVEEALNGLGFPPPALACSLAEYVALVCGLLDVPLPTTGRDDCVRALHLLFSLYSAVKSSQLYADRQKERGG